MKRLMIAATMALLVPMAASAYCIDAVQPSKGVWHIQYKNKMKLNGVTYYCNRNDDCRTKDEWLKCLEKMDFSEPQKPKYVYEKGSKEEAKRKMKSRTQEM